MNLLDDPNKAGILSLGLRLMSTPGKFGSALGQAGLGAMGDIQQAKQAQAMAKQKALQEQMLMMQLEQIKAQQATAKSAQERQANDQGLMQRLMGMPVEGMMPQGQMGPGMPSANSGVDPRAFLNQGGSMAGLQDVLGLNQILSPPKKAPLITKPGDIARNPETGEQMWSNPEAPEKDDADVRLLKLVHGENTPAFFSALSQLASKKTTHAPGTNVIVGTGKVGELETSYRKEFNALPEVVRYKSAIPAFKAVEGAANRPGTQSEINLIYGLAKLYDPESVVREGEYDTIANSQSIPEWLKGQAQRLAGGGKLTPETKRQILIEARARKAALEDEYNGAQKTYEAIAKRQGLDPQNVFTPIGGYSTPGGGKPKSRMVEIDGGGSVSATLGEDGNYYVKRGGKTYRVEE